MAGHISLTWTDRRCPAEDEVYPLQIKALRADEETSVYRQDRKLLTGSSCEEENEERRTSVSGGRRMGEESSDDELGQLDIDLNRKSKQHNLTSRNVRAILHEVITHEHVVAMMKAAIRDTQDLPMFEPKMTRSRLKQAVQQGQPLNWSLSTNTIKPPQFVDIDLEENEDSSDEEYCPDEEEEEEDMVEETFLSDADSLASPPRMHQGSPLRVPSEKRMDKSLQKSPGLPREQVMTSTCASQHILTGPEPSFLDKLNAVEEELDCSPAYTYNQAEGGVDEDCLAYRTRSRLPLVNVPLGQLEAKLLAPDITADMYDLSVGQREEDRHWTEWLQGLMTPDSEGEAEDDDDDPEYNVLDDLDEPDLEDYRTDRAVQITKKEVNELLEELFDTLQEEEVAEEEEIPPKAGTKFNIPQALRFEPPLAGLLTERRQTVRKQYEALQQRRALQDTTNHHHSNLKNTPSPPPNTITPILVLPGQVCPTLHVDYTQKLQLQQQIQQHVQLLTQVQLLSRHINALNHEACITKQYLEELQQFSHRRETVFLPSSFRVCNLQGALDLLQEVEQKEKPSPAPATSRRLLPRMTPATNSHAFPLLPTDTAWLFATRPVFLYPELLPVCSLDPALHSRHQRSVYTAGEDGLIVLGLKHFEGTVQSDELISSYLLCKNRWNFRKHIREMSSQRAPPNNVIKMFLKHGVVPPLPLACSRVQPTDQRPPVDRNNSNMPNWLKNSRQIIQKTRLDSNSYPPSLPPGCTLRLHPYWLYKSRPPVPHHRRLFMLAHNASLLPLAKAPGERYTDRQAQPISCLSLPPLGGRLLLQPPSVSGGLPLAPPHVCGTFPLAAAHPVPTHCLPIGQTITRQQTPPHPLLLSSSTNPIMSLTPAAVKPACFLLQMVWTPPTAKSQHALEQGQNRPIREEQEEGSQSSSNLKLIEEDRQDEEEEESLASASTLSQLSSIGEKDEVWKKEENQVEEKEEVERKKWTVVGLVSLNGGENTGGEGGGRGEGGGAGGGGGEQDESRGGDGEQGGEGEEEEARERGQGGGEREENGEKDEDQDRQGEEEEEEDFDDLTQDEDEEEVMSSASEESVLSVPELQETMKQLTWLAAERRLCADGDSEEDHSPTSEEEEEEGGPKEEGPGKGRTSKGGEDEEMPSGEGTARGGGGRCPGRGRGRSRPLRGLRRSRQERHSKDAAKLLLLYDEKLLENDPHRESKDMAFAKSYLSRVCEALQDAPGQVEEFVSLLNEFEQVGEGQEEVVPLFRKLRCILGDRTDLLRDFAAFLHPEQALQCGLFEEQQAFERSRRFLRQLEISFGDNPSHYQKIIKALQTSPDLSPNGIAELKAQMATLLKGHAHLQAEFWVFFDELRPPLARPGQFEEAHWPEEGGGGSDGGEGGNQLSAGGASSGFEEVTLPELDEEDEGHKIQPMTNRRRRRKIDPHRKYKGCDWSDKDWPCSCHDVKIRRHRRKGCSRCHDNKTPGAVSRAMKNLDPLYSQISSSHTDKDLDLKGDDDSPQPDRSSASWEGPFPLTEEEEELGEEEDDEDEEERKNSEKEHSLAVKRSRREEPLLPPTVTPSSSSVTDSSVRSSIFTSVSSSLFTSSSGPPRPSPPPDLPVCAKNISLTASGKKVILWTREADRVILTTCQQDGANQNTFQAISTLLGNKTPSEVSRRFRDLMRLFRTAARQTSSEDEAPSTETAGATNQEED